MMLQGLGALFYLSAAITFILVLGAAEDLDLGAYGWGLAIAAVTSNLFFGAICFAIDDIRSYAKRVADHLAPEAAPSGEAPATPRTTCDWCGVGVPAPNKPCSAIDLDRWPEIGPRIRASRCKHELAERGLFGA